MSRQSSGGADAGWHTTSTLEGGPGRCVLLRKIVGRYWTEIAVLRRSAASMPQTSVKYMLNRYKTAKSPYKAYPYVLAAHGSSTFNILQYLQPARYVFLLERSIWGPIFIF